MKNENKATETLNTESGKSKNMPKFIILTVAGLLFGILLAITFAFEDQGTMISAEHTSATDAQRYSGGQKQEAIKVARNNAQISAAAKNGEPVFDYDDSIEEVKNAFGDREAMNVLPAPKYYPRPESEWQGMLVDTSLQSICEGKNSCGLAMACMDNRCGACSVDADCATGENCVLNHCVIKKNTSCRTASDCDTNEYCVLSGYSSDPRGNKTTLAYCQPITSGSQPTQEQTINAAAFEPGPAVFNRSVSIDQLQETLSENDNGLDTEIDLPQPVNPESFDETTAEFEFEQHESLDNIDPENEHTKVPEEELNTDPNFE